MSAVSFLISLEISGLIENSPDRAPSRINGDGRMNISSVSRVNCPICGSKGKILHRDLTDRNNNVDGKWNFRICQNQNCAFVWVDPLPNPDEIHKAYKNYYTHDRPKKNNSFLRKPYALIKGAYLANKYGYNKKYFSLWKRLFGYLIYLHPLRRASTDFNVMYLKSMEGGSLLDVGCGNGERMKLMKELGWKVEGVDSDPAAVEDGLKKGLNIRLGQLEDQTSEDDHFDAVVLSHLIEHVHDPKTLLSECHRILKTNGTLAIMTPNIESLGHRIFGADWAHLDPPRHLHIFKCASLAEIVSKASFKNIQFRTMLHGGDISFTWSAAYKTNAQAPQKRISLFIKIVGLAMEIIEYVCLKINKSCGEEVYLVANK